MTVLPPKEGFSPNCVGAVGLLVHRLAQPEDLIVGKVLNNLPFTGAHYLEVSKTWSSVFMKNKSYAYGVACLVKKYTPCLIEIHNRPDIALYIAQKFPQIPVSLTLHNNPLSMRGLKTKTERQKIIKILHIIAVSQWVKDRFLSDDIVGNVKVLSNHIDLTEVPEYVPIHQREKTILFVGRVVADKGADIFVSICQQLLKEDPTWKIEMIGADRFDPNSPQTPFIQKLCQKITYEQIKMIGYLPYNLVLQKMSQASVVIMPSRWEEPFGMTALEAMACGTPLLVSAVGALPQVVGEGALLMDPKKPEEAFSLLSLLLRNYQLQKELSEKGRKQAFLYNTEKALFKLTAYRRQICPVLEK